MGTSAEWRTFLGATDTASNSSKGLATPKMVYDLQEKTIGSSSAGVALSGTVGNPIITVTGGSVANNVNNVVTGSTVYNYITKNYQQKDADLTAIAALTGTSGFLKKTATDTWSLDTSTYLTTSSASSTYLTKSDATSTYATNATAVGGVEFNSSKGLRYKTIDKLGSVADSDYNVIASIATLKSALLSISDDDFTAILNAV